MLKCCGVRLADLGIWNITRVCCGRSEGPRMAQDRSGGGASAMMVEEDCVGFSTIEVGDKHAGP